MNRLQKDIVASIARVLHVDPQKAEQEAIAVGKRQVVSALAVFKDGVFQDLPAVKAFRLKVTELKNLATRLENQTRYMQEWPALHGSNNDLERLEKVNTVLEESRGLVDDMAHAAVVNDGERGWGHDASSSTVTAAHNGLDLPIRTAPPRDNATSDSTGGSNGIYNQICAAGILTIMSAGSQTSQTANTTDLTST
ncbi:hypothetical protein LTR64_000346 [Lithohypha guttulata]|uniref:uncharacterized protein n=1 Tax=Lithohypha guttulata TaxID=1690604 RepID=UPI002DE019FD|nr:hypothetical protein LTR51_005884 [Lithohypha guttulata]